MRFKVLYSGTWQILAALDEQDCCEVLEALVALAGDRKTKATAAGFRAQWRLIPNEGPQRLGTDVYHRVDDPNKINEFIKGNHRLLCFEAEGKVVVCSHVIRKKSPKTKASDRKRAAKLRDAYIAAAKAGEIEIVSDRENEDEQG